MKPAIRFLGGLSLCLGFVSSCDAGQEAVSPALTPSQYRNAAYQVALDYPAGWTVESEGDQSLTVAPLKDKSWQPAAPSDIPKDPRVRIDLGEHVRERLGPGDFPEALDEKSLRRWLEQKLRQGEAQDFSERTISQAQAFEITEKRVPGCDRVVYWRPINLRSLVRLATGCESPYLAEFDQIVSSLRTVE